MPLANELRRSLIFQIINCNRTNHTIMIMILSSCLTFFGKLPQPVGSLFHFGARCRGAPKSRRSGRKKLETIRSNGYLRDGACHLKIFVVENIFTGWFRVLFLNKVGGSGYEQRSK
jgi:hypothetical protein